MVLRVFLGQAPPDDPGRSPSAVGGRAAGREAQSPQRDRARRRSRRLARRHAASPACGQQWPGEGRGELLACTAL